MATLDFSVEQPSDDPQVSREPPRLIVSAGHSESRRRIWVTMATQGLRPSLQVDSPTELFDLRAGPSAIVLLACNLDAAPEIRALRRLRHKLPAPSIIAISPVTTGAGVRRALEAGADAVVFEPELESTLAVAVSAVASGQSIVPRKTRASVARPALSHRERQVLAYVAKGLTNDQIADQLFLSKSTIKSHLSSVFTKFGVLSRREAAALFRDMERAAPDQDGSGRAVG